MEEQERNELYERVLAACTKENNFTTYFIQKTFALGYAQASEIKDTFYENGVLIDENPEMNYGKSDPLYNDMVAACEKANDFSVQYIQRIFAISLSRAKAMKDAYELNK